MTATATYDSASNTFTLKIGMWWNAYPIDDLGSWLKFYRDQRVRFPKSGTSYDGTIAALEKLARERGLSL
ncbi:uL18 family ribosomal protein [Pseudodonghicola xiamenensis]|uniref:Uncharacterized protein n=1 Tax=Pseudodonghicola xiamenensis TaxID=337702 RepID=A0A8J3H9A6_9RHOB|nr:hypothetical protein [Pseudodonghicola xiamenensis]GHG92999.1 hypothetical protein GCM10010961_25190 [Pseudodonghicola xiamenensis]